MTPAEIRAAIEVAFRSLKPALIESMVDAEEKPAKPHVLKV